MPVMAHTPVVAPRVVVRGVARAPVATAATRTTSSSRIVMRSGALRPRPAGTTVRVTRRPAAPVSNTVFLDADEDDFPQDFFPVPGLGFDIPHLAATQGARAVGAGRHHHGFGMSFPFFGGAIFVPTSPVMEEETPATQASDEIVETQPVRVVRRERVQEPATSATVEAAPAALRESDEYVFVRRNGTLIFAVAYSWESGTLRYVTREGLWHIVSGDMLDLNATKQFNEQRGLFFHLPA